jgi:ribosomal protein S18 acetylase RimI-like enzyme
MTDTIIYSIALPQDAHGITNVRRKTWFTTYVNEEIGITREDIESSHNKRTVEEESLQRANRIKNNPDTRIWVAKDSGSVIGFVEAQRTDSVNRIRAFYILQEYQKHGIGTELMKKALEWLDRQKDITCEVASFNKNAIKFYKKFGFEENGPTSNDVSELPSGKMLPETEMLLKHMNS